MNIDPFLRLASYTFRPFFEGEGVALMFHRVLEEKSRSPYLGLRGLEVLPSVFEAVINYFIKRGFTFLSANQLAESMSLGEMPKKFVVITFDDGYLDNAHYVSEFMASKNLPWTLYLTTGFCDRTLPCWWYGIAQIIDKNRSLDLRPIGGNQYGATSLAKESKDQIYSQIRELIHSHWATLEFQEKVSEWSKIHGVDLLALTNQLAMSWDDVRRISGMGCDVAAHTTQHQNLLQCDETLVESEMRQSKIKIEDLLGLNVNTFAYPFGDQKSCGQREFDIARKSGYDLAFSTRNDWIQRSLMQFRWSLPRINVSGSWDSLSKVLFRVNGWSNLTERGLKFFG